MIARDLTNARIVSEIRKNPVAIIPVGSIEQHGPHLPISTDSDIISFIAQKVAERTRALVLPTVQCGVSSEHHPFFNLSTSPGTLQKYIASICVSLWKNGVRTIIILNGHHGNQSALKRIPTIATKGRKGLRILVCPYWHFMKRRFDHAGFVETSIMLAISGRVEMGKAERGLDEGDYTKRELERLGRIANRSFISVTKNGVWGDPRGSTASEGRKILAEVTSSIVRKIRSLPGSAAVKRSG